MGKMTDALRKAKMLKDVKEGRIPAPSAPSSAPIPSPALGTSQNVVAPPKPAPSAPVAPPKLATPRVARPELGRPAPSRPAQEGTVPDSGTVPSMEPEPILEDEPGEVTEVEIPSVESLPIIEEPVEAPRAKPAETPREKPAEPKPILLPPEEEVAPAPAPAREWEVEAKPEPQGEPEGEPEPAPTPEPTPVPEPVPTVAWPAVEEKNLGQSQTAGQSQLSGTVPMKVLAVPEAPAEAPPPPAAVEPGRTLPAVEPTLKPACLPYLSVHYGRDERMTDEFRRLKSRLNEEGPARVILVVSPRPGEGKTTIALNLASSFANTFGEKVVVVDGNIPRPKIGEVLEVAPQAPGLSRAVKEKMPADKAAVETSVGGLYAVTAPARPGEGTEGLLDSDGMRSLLQSLRGRFTRVIVELPAAEDRPDGLALAAHADVVLVPVTRSRSRRKAVRRLVEMLKDRGAPRVRCVFIET